MCSPSLHTHTDTPLIPARYKNLLACSLPASQPGHCRFCPCPGSPSQAQLLFLLPHAEGRLLSPHSSCSGTDPPQPVQPQPPLIQTPNPTGHPKSNRSPQIQHVTPNPNCFFQPSRSSSPLYEQMSSPCLHAWGCHGPMDRWTPLMDTHTHI